MAPAENHQDPNKPQSLFASLKHFFRRWRRPLAGLLLLLLLVGGLLIANEVKTSHFQASYLANYAAGLDYRLVDGASDAIRFPAHGPFDQRMGYTELPQTIERLGSRGFVLKQQARFSGKLMDY